MLRQVGLVVVSWHLRMNSGCPDPLIGKNTVFVRTEDGSFGNVKVVQSREWAEKGRVRIFWWQGGVDSGWRERIAMTTNGRRVV